MQSAGKTLRVLMAAAALEALCAAGNAGVYHDSVVADNPVGYWRLGETSGTTAVDEASPQNNGVYLNGVTLGQPGALFGDPDTAAGFDSDGEKMDVPYSPDLNPASFTFEVWAKVALGAGTGYRSPMTSRGDGPQEGYIFYAQGGRWQYWTGPGWNNVQAPVSSVVEGAWAHLVGTYDATTQEKRFYLNGYPVGRATGLTVNPNNADPLRIGGGATEGNGNYWFRGDVDEAAVYDAALAPESILNHYHAGIYNALPAFETVFHTDFANPGGAGLGPDAARMVLAGQTNASPTPTNPDGMLVLGGGGTGGIVFVNELQPFQFDRGPLLVSTRADFVNDDAPPSQANAYMGLVALHQVGTDSSGPDRRGGLWAQFQPYSNGTGHIRLGFQSDSTATGGDLWIDNLFDRSVSGFADANQPFDLELAIYGLEDMDQLAFTVSQDDWAESIVTTVGSYRSAVRARNAEAGDALDLVLSELIADPTLMNVGLISTSSRTDGYSFLHVDAAVAPGGLIPEPSTFALAALGLLGLGVAGRRRRKK